MKEARPRSSSTRLYVILARKASLGVIFRRGPTKQVALISWDTDRHEFRLGQWLKGRIYERRCDLAPSGQKLIYFAAKFRDPHYTWSAVSRPPFLTALLMWPKGDAWGGGGLFADERTIALNHDARTMKLGEDFRLPKTIKVEQFSGGGRGEDNPIAAARLRRDGWVCISAGGREKESRTGPMWIEFLDREIWTRTRGDWTIEMVLVGINEMDGPWYVTEHRLLDAKRNVALDLGRSDWADWSRSGELLFARQGRLYRVPIDRRTGPGAAEELIDLRSLRFTSVEPPPEALAWGGQPVAGSRIR
jgi:hypothetical protein